MLVRAGEPAEVRAVALTDAREEESHWLLRLLRLRGSRCRLRRRGRSAEQGECSQRARELFAHRGLFKPVAPDAPVDPAAWTNANNRPDYNYDQFSGVEYDVDVSQPVGSRIVGLSYQGVPVAAGQQFLVAVNNYRQSGGGGFPHIATAPVVYNAQVAIREAIVSYASEAGTIDPATFHVVSWRLVRNGTPVF